MTEKMKQLKKQIEESFYNPVIYFLPTVVFMVVDNFGEDMNALKASFPVAFVLIFYVYFKYRRMFVWTSFMSVGYLIIGFTSTLLPNENIILFHIDELLFIFLTMLMILSKQKLEKLAIRTLPHELPMSNNENEIFRVAKVVTAITSIYLIAILFVSSGAVKNNPETNNLIDIIYAVSISFEVVLETIRVLIIRNRLLNEDWLPIVNDQGKVIGSTQYQEDAVGMPRLTHPVVRLYFIEDGMLCLQQRNANDLSEQLLWDASISHRLRVSESVDNVLKGYSNRLFHFEPEKFIFLTNYIYQGKYSDQYIYLFISCKTEGMQPDKDCITTKWWTSKQIEENLGKTVFTERFEKEFEILKRSGLFDQGLCDCECALKNLIKDQIKR